MRANRQFDVAGRLAVPRRRRAVVIGGSLAGMLAAQILSRHFDSITLLERDRFPETPAARKGLPQGRPGRVERPIRSDDRVLSASVQTWVRPSPE